MLRAEVRGACGARELRDDAAGIAGGAVELKELGQWQALAERNSTAELLLLHSSPPLTALPGAALPSNAEQLAPALPEGSAELLLLKKRPRA